MREQFDQTLIEAGKLSPLEQAADNPFAVFADEFKRAAQTQRAADVERLKIAETKANYRREKLERESRESADAATSDESSEPEPAAPKKTRLKRPPPPHPQ
jgi:hypothetical protein